MKTVPDFDDVLAAQARLKGHAKTTPLMRSDDIDTLTGLSVWFKPECTQKVGAFKYRGAFNRLSAMSEAERARGVVAFSSGNHAQGVSRSAKELGMSAVIVMPMDAPSIKVDGVKRDGAKIVFYDRNTESREDLAAQIAREENRIIVPSYDDPYIIAGQGTTGLEIAEEARTQNINFDAVITPIGGGGLCAGISLALNALSPRTKMFGAEPNHYNDHQMSLREGRRVKIKSTPPTLCDAILTPTPGEITFAINQHSLTDVFTVSDEECLIAMGAAKAYLGVQAEPGGAAAFAALWAGRFKSHPEIETICVILSGGNVDPDVADLANERFAQD